MHAHFGLLHHRATLPLSLPLSLFYVYPCRHCMTCVTSFALINLQFASLFNLSPCISCAVKVKVETLNATALLRLTRCLVSWRRSRDQLSSQAHWGQPFASLYVYHRRLHFKAILSLNTKPQSVRLGLVLKDFTLEVLAWYWQWSLDSNWKIIYLMPIGIQVNLAIIVQY